MSQTILRPGSTRSGATETLKSGLMDHMSRIGELDICFCKNPRVRVIERNRRGEVVYDIEII